MDDVMKIHLLIDGWGNRCTADGVFRQQCIYFPNRQSANVFISPTVSLAE